MYVTMSYADCTPGREPRSVAASFFVSLFLLLFANKRPSPFFYICPTKKPLFLTHKLSILQLNQARFDLPGSAIIRPTHKPQLPLVSQKIHFINSEKIFGVSTMCAQILGFSRVRVRVRVSLIGLW